MSENAGNPRIFVGNIPLNTRSDAIRDLFASFGSIRDVYVIPKHADSNEEKMKVSFESPESAQRAIDEMNGTDYDGNKLIVQFGKQKQDRNRGDYNGRGDDRGSYRDNYRDNRDRGGYRNNSRDRGDNRGGDGYRSQGRDGGRDRGNYRNDSRDRFNNRGRNQRDSRDRYDRNDRGRNDRYDRDGGRGGNRDNYQRYDNKNQEAGGYAAQRNSRLDLRLIVSNIPEDCRWTDLKDWAKGVGRVKYADISRDNRSEGVVEFLDGRDFDRALNELNEIDLLGSRVDVKKFLDGVHQNKHYVPEDKSRGKSRSRSRSRDRGRSRSRSANTDRD